MPHDPVRTADTRAWLEKAALDMRSARVDLEAVPPILGDALFHCQQAVEKSLKAFLAWHDTRFRKTHDLVELGMQCTFIDSELESVLREAAPLTEYAWKYRYPGDVPEPTQAEADRGLALATMVFETLIERLPADVRPHNEQ
jgi:HEPN domain-containing protein